MTPRITFVFWLVTTLGISLGAHSAELEADYLLGTWVVDQSHCSDTNSEFVIFRENGAVESVHEGKLEAAGFWILRSDVVSGFARLLL